MNFQTINESVLALFNEAPELRKSNDEEKNRLVSVVQRHIELLLQYKDQKGPKRIDFKPADGIIRFVGKSGNVYKVQQTLTAGRYPELLICQEKLKYNRPIEESWEMINKAVELQNKMQFVDSSAILVNLRDGVLDVQKARSHVFMTCALFCNTDNENIAEVNIDKLDEKIADWEEYAYDDFFTLVGTMFPFYFKVYEQLTQAIIQMPGIKDMV